MFCARKRFRFRAGQGLERRPPVDGFRGATTRRGRGVLRLRSAALILKLLPTTMAVSQAAPSVVAADCDVGA